LAIAGNLPGDGVIALSPPWPLYTRHAQKWGLLALILPGPVATDNGGTVRWRKSLILRAFVAAGKAGAK